MRVLVVDDLSINRVILSDMLASAQIEAVEAADGHAALALLEAQPFDLVLMDVRMPGMDGFEAVRAIRRMGSGIAATPVVIVTGDVTDETARQAAACGANDVLHKPVELTKLLDAVARIAVGSGRSVLP